MNIPLLRFDGFDESWTNKRLVDITKVNQGLQIPISERFLEPGDNRYFYITNEFLKKNSKYEYYIETPSDSVICTKEDILMTRTGNTGMVVTGVSGAFHNNFFKIKYNEKIVQKNFLELFLKHPKTQNAISKSAGQSTIPDLNHKDFYKLEIKLPSILEQEKLGSFFMLLNQKIEKQQEKIEKMEEFKKGMMQKVFSQNLRFKDEDGRQFPEWEVKKMMELGSFFRGTGLSKADLILEGRPCVLYGQLYTTYGSVINKVFSYCSPDIKSFIGQVNDVLIPSSGETAWDIACASALNIDSVALGGDLNVFRPNKGIEGNFISYQINSMKKHELSKLAQGASVVHLYSNSLKKIKLSIPSYKEQKKIANYFLNIELKIEKENEKLKILERQKKGFMQLMFI